MIVGENGAGKSTLLKIILGLVYPTSGTIKTNDLKIGYVPEKLTPPPFITIYDFLLVMNNIKNGKVEDIDYYLKYWELNNDKDKKIKELSKGMLQKVIITQALLGTPDCLIFDEALNGLDRDMQKKLLDLIKKEKKNKIIIITSHYQDYYKDVVDKTLLIKDGRIWEN